MLTRCGPSWSSLVTPSNLIVVSISSLITDLISRASLYRENGLLTFNGVHHSLLSIGQRVQEGSTHADAFRPQAKGFNNVCTSPTTSIDIHLHNGSASDGMGNKPVELTSHFLNTSGQILFISSNVYIAGGDPSRARPLYCHQPLSQKIHNWA